jgi:hypothetical protein
MKAERTGIFRSVIPTKQVSLYPVSYCQFRTYRYRMDPGNRIRIERGMRQVIGSHFYCLTVAEDTNSLALPSRIDST